MAESELLDFAEEAQSVLDTDPDADEANTKAKVVQPLLEVLGWSVRHDAELEFSLQMGSSQHSVDYALQIDGVLQLFVEAKGAYNDLADRHRSQLTTYMMTENVDWGLLTNGWEYELCRRRVDDDENVVVDVFGSVGLSELPEETALLTAFSKESIREGRARAVADRRRGLEAAYEKLHQKEPSVVAAVTDTLVDSLSEAVEEEAEATARAAVNDLRSRLQVQTTGDPGVAEPDLFWARVEDQTGIIKQDTMVEFPDDRTATSCFTDFVDLLFTDGFLDGTDVPIESGRKRYLLNHRPVDKAGDEMESPRTVGDGFSLETNYSVNDMRQRVLELAEQARTESEPDSSD